MLSVASAGALPEVISMASDVATAGRHLADDLRVSAHQSYARDVLAWWHGSRDIPCEVSNPDGTADVWVWAPVASQAVA